MGRSKHAIRRITDHFTPSFEQRNGQACDQSCFETLVQRLQPFEQRTLIRKHSLQKLEQRKHAPLPMAGRNDLHFSMRSLRSSIRAYRHRSWSKIYAIIRAFSFGSCPKRLASSSAYRHSAIRPSREWIFARSKGTRWSMGKALEYRARSASASIQRRAFAAFIARAR